METILSITRYLCFAVSFFAGVLSTFSVKLHHTEENGDRRPGWKGLTKSGRMVVVLLASSFLLGVSLQYLSDTESAQSKLNAQREEQRRERILRDSRDAIIYPLNSLALQVRFGLAFGVGDTTLSKFANAWTDFLPPISEIQGSPLVDGLIRSNWVVDIKDDVTAPKSALTFFPNGEFEDWAGANPASGNRAQMWISDDQIYFGCRINFLQMARKVSHEDVVSIRNLEGKMIEITATNLPKFYFENRVKEFDLTKKAENEALEAKFESGGSVSYRMDMSFILLSRERGDMWKCENPVVDVVETSADQMTMRIQARIPSMRYWD